MRSSPLPRGAAAFVSASHELSQEYREFERASTVVANAYVGPRVAQYLAQLEQHLKQQGFGGDFFVVQSTGGLFPNRACAPGLRPNA